MFISHGLNKPAGSALRAATAVALAVTVLVSAGCGSESDAAGTLPEIDLSKLDTGGYETKPRDPAPLNPVAAAHNLEALRLAEVMPLPKDIDSALIHGSGRAKSYTNLASLSPAVDLSWFEEENFDSDTAGLIGGFYTTAQSNPSDGLSYALTNNVMIFDSDNSAAAAANALSRSGFSSPDLDHDSNRTPPVETTSLRFPAAKVLWKPNNQVLASWYATGRFVISTLVRNEENFQLRISDLPGLLALSDKAITVTMDRLSKFVPTPPNALTSLALDPTGMVRITLPIAPREAQESSFNGVLSATAELHRRPDQDKARALFDRTGVDNISYGAGMLVRTRDATAAETYIDEVSINKFRVRIDPPQELPTARCFKYHGPSWSVWAFDCYVSVGRYAAYTRADQVQETYQQISAQYAILANDK
ncbi:hypothetical protein [Nocardia sp. NPDC057668]|uniref:DUF7373 family lipoprotein n=1 Tax=Nocardia sp. NPDC057668 TaxID=3346202 RepID=UPI00366CA68A